MTFWPPTAAAAAASSRLLTRGAFEGTETSQNVVGGEWDQKQKEGNEKQFTCMDHVLSNSTD